MERHTIQGNHRGQKYKPEDEPRDYHEDYGSHTSATDRAKLARREVPFSTMTGEPIPCRLCEPDRVCSFHRED